MGSKRYFAENGKLNQLKHVVGKCSMACKLSGIGGCLLTKKVQLLVVGSCLCMFLGSVSAKDLPDFTKLVEANAKAVVNISTIGKKQGARSFGRPRGDERLEEFFRFFGPPGSYRRSPNPQTRSLGSGFIIS